LEAASFFVPSASVARRDAQHVMTLNYPPRATKKKREGVVRTVVSVELADKMRRMATEENCTLSDMIALLLARAVEKK
jgi:hypothetical protein